MNKDEFEFHGGALTYNGKIVVQAYEGHLHVSLFRLKEAGFRGNFELSRGMFGQDTLLNENINEEEKEIVKTLTWITETLDVGKFGDKLPLEFAFLVDKDKNVYARLRQKGPFGTKVARVYKQPAPLASARIVYGHNGTEYERKHFKDWYSFPRMKTTVGNGITKSLNDAGTAVRIK